MRGPRELTSNVFLFCWQQTLEPVLKFPLPASIPPTCKSHHLKLSASYLFSGPLLVRETALSLTWFPETTMRRLLAQQAEPRAKLKSGYETSRLLQWLLGWLWAEASGFCGKPGTWHACPLHFSTHVYSAYLSIIFLLPLENQLLEVTISVIIESRTWNSGWREGIPVDVCQTDYACSHWRRTWGQLRVQQHWLFGAMALHRSWLPFGVAPLFSQCPFKATECLCFQSLPIY